MHDKEMLSLQRRLPCKSHMAPSHFLITTLGADMIISVEAKLSVCWLCLLLWGLLFAQSGGWMKEQGPKVLLLFQRGKY